MGKILVWNHYFLYNLFSFLSQCFSKKLLVTSLWTFKNITFRKHRMICISFVFMAQVDVLFLSLLASCPVSSHLVPPPHSVWIHSNRCAHFTLITVFLKSERAGGEAQALLCVYLLFLSRTTVQGQPNVSGLDSLEKKKHPPSSSSTYILKTLDFRFILGVNGIVPGD